MTIKKKIEILKAMANNKYAIYESDKERFKWAFDEMCGIEQCIAILEDNTTAKEIAKIFSIKA